MMPGRVTGRVDLTREEGVASGIGVFDIENEPVELVSAWDPHRHTFRRMTPQERDELEAVGREMQRIQRLHRDAAERAKVLSDRAASDRLTEQLQRRDRLEHRLRAANIDPMRWSDREQWREHAGDDVFDRLLRDVVGLPEEFCDFDRGVDELLNDPMHWRVLRETLSSSAYAAAGRLPPQPVHFAAGGDTDRDARRDGEITTESDRRAGAVGRAIESVAAEDPAGFVFRSTPTGDLDLAVDPHTRLGERLGDIGTGLTDVFSRVGVAPPIADPATDDVPTVESRKDDHAEPQPGAPTSRRPAVGTVTPDLGERPGDE